MKTIDMITMAAACVGMLTGLCGLLLSIYNFFFNRLEVLKEFVMDGDTAEWKDARKYLMECNEGSMELLSDETFKKNASLLISRYNARGFLVRKRHLPISLFSRDYGLGAIRIYRKTERYIEFRRINNKYYAEDFTYLYSRIVKKYPELAGIAKAECEAMEMERADTKLMDWEGTTKKLRPQEQSVKEAAASKIEKAPPDKNI